MAVLPIRKASRVATHRKWLVATREAHPNRFRISARGVTSLLLKVRCIRLKDSAFGTYYHRLVARGMNKRGALMAVMRKMLVIAYRLLRTEESYDPTKVCARPVARLA